MEMFEMLIDRMRENEYIINVNNAEFGMCIEDVIHDVLEFRGCIF
jgi:hypothetical protein